MDVVSTRRYARLARRHLSAPFAWCSRSPLPPLAWVFLLWFVLVVPAIGIRGVHYEEGTTVGLARGAFEDGHWLTPFLYGVRFPERPVLVSWFLGAVGATVGCLPLWLARLPMVLALLAGALLVHGLVRQHASVRAALFASVCFLVSPVMLQKTVTAEVDGVVSVLLFVAFVVWWAGHARGGSTVGRWLAIAAILSVASLVKGPQPLGYFFTGVGAYLILQRRWRELVALVLVGVVAGAVVAAWYWTVYRPGDLTLWRMHSRIRAPQSVGGYVGGALHFTAQVVVEWLPGILLAAPLAVGLVRQRRTRNRNLALALCLYGGVCTAILVFWPDSHSRYAMPAVLAVAAAAGLAFDESPGSLVDLAQAGATCLITYAVVVNWLILPLRPTIGQQKHRYAEYIALTIAQRPGSLYVTSEALDRQVLVYLTMPVHRASFDTIRQLPPPFFAVLSPEQEELLRTSRGDDRVVLHFSLAEAGGSRFVELLPR